MRAFIGIALPAPVRAAIVASRERFLAEEPSWCDDKWVPDENLHVTVKFLGDVDESQVEALTSALAEACRSVEPFELELRRLRPVPNARRGQMLWVSGTEAGDRPVHAASLAAAIDRALEPLGFEAETRSFKAHVTLCRTRRPRRAARESLAAAEGILDAGPDSMSVRSVTVYRSTLGGSAPVYEPLAEVPLGND